VGRDTRAEAPRRLNASATVSQSGMIDNPFMQTSVTSKLEIFEPISGLPGGVTGVNNSVDWYVEAHLYLRSGVRGKMAKSCSAGNWERQSIWRLRAQSTSAPAWLSLAQHTIRS
jgi:hypothetical protein